VDGFVRELIVADGGADLGALALADDAGARIVQGDLAAACAAARQPWLLILPAGVRVQMAWEPAARAHIKRHPHGAGWFQLNYAENGLGLRLAEAWSNGVAQWLSAARPQHGLLIAARQWQSGRTKTLKPIRARVLVGGFDLDG
jgi:hypothetical protein